MVVHVPCQRLMVGNQVVVRWRARVAVYQLVELEKQEQQPCLRGQKVALREHVAS